MSSLAATLMTLAFTGLGVVNVFLIGRTWDLNNRMRDLHKRIRKMEGPDAPHTEYYFRSEIVNADGTPVEEPDE